MLLPLAIAFGSTLVGAFLGIGGRGTGLPALRTFALVSALAVVLAQLLPEALAETGLWALALFAVGALFPAAIEKIGARLGRGHNHRVGLELGYAALWVHKVADGIGLGTYTGERHAGHHHHDIVFALAAHTVPMVALVAMVYQKRDGTRWAIARVAGLAVATGIGVAVTALVPTEAFERFEPWLTAAVAGLLFHVVVHDWAPERGPRRPGERLVDLIAVAAGIALAVLGGDPHHEPAHGPSVRDAVGAALWELALETAPALLIGLVIGAVLSSIGSGRLPMRWLRSGGALRQAIRGAVLGAPLPICACGVLPLAQTLRTRGAGAALVVAFLIATPELGVETFALTGRLLGWPFAVVRLVAAVAVAMVGGVVAYRIARASSGEPRLDDRAHAHDGHAHAHDGHAHAHHGHAHAHHGHAHAHHGHAQHGADDAHHHVHAQHGADDAHHDVHAHHDHVHAHHDHDHVHAHHDHDHVQAHHDHDHVQAHHDQHGHDHAHDHHGHAHAAGEPSFARRVVANFDELVHHVAPWTVVGLVAAAYVQAVLGADSLGPMRAFGLDIAIVTVVAVPSYVCAASATPLAAVLLAKGLSPGAVLVGLLLGPATNLATFGFLRRSYGARAAWVILGSIVATTWAIAIAIDVSAVPLAPREPLAAGHEHGAVALGCFVLVAIALARSVWRVGLRAWLGSLADSFAPAPAPERATISPAE